MAPNDDDALEAQLDELYGLPLDAFTSARDELARELHKAGDRGGADRVKALRKPNLVAWALNQVRRHDPERVEKLLSAGEQLREAQSKLLAGGEHGLLRDAVAQERLLIDELAQLAERELAQAGNAPSVAIQNKLRQTLQAAARDEQTRELLSVGRLLKDGQITDLGLGGLGGAVAEGTPAPAGRSRATPTPSSAPQRGSRAAAASAATTEPSRRSARDVARDAARERKLKAARGRLERAREEQQEREQELAELVRAATQARNEADQAASVAERAEETAGRAEAAAERAGVKAGRAAERSRELEVALTELEAEA